MPWSDSNEDAYTGQVRVVDNVPLGPAAAGSILSNMGYRLTRLFEQGFSTPSMTGHGFADSLQVMASVRKNLLSRVQLGKANSPNTGGDLENSLINYVNPDASVDTALDAHIGRGEPVHHHGSSRQNGGVKRGPVQLAVNVRAVPDGHGNPGMAGNRRHVGFLDPGHRADAGLWRVGHGDAFFGQDAGRRFRQRKDQFP